MSEPAYLSTNPLHGNPLRTRADLQVAMRAMVEPLVPYFSPGRGRVRLGATGAHFQPRAAELEGLARPLWGLAPLTAGGGAFEHWPLFQCGLAHGTDPAHEDYWGAPTDRDQRIVEAGALGFALALVPEQLWPPLSERERQALGRWLETVFDLEVPPTNWNFFPIMVALGLDRVGWPVDWSRLEQRFEAVESYYLGAGWYRDGPLRRLDHYIAFAFHFYGLIYAKLRKGDVERRTRLIERATIFAQHYRHWFAADGSALPFGRSLTYRFAHGAFWAALAFAGIEALPWGEIKGLLLGNLRWWQRLPIADRDRVLSVGYGYPNYLMSEEYNSPGSPYWAAKTFAVLALGEEHPFWQAAEVPPVGPKAVLAQPEPGMVLFGEAGGVVALSAGQENLLMRGGPEKYAKFTYSTSFAFSVESHDTSFRSGAFDGMLAFSDDDRHFRVRATNDDARIGDTYLYCRWRPWTDVDVETWLLALPPWHLRIHRISSPRILDTAEGGFAVSRAEETVLFQEEMEGLALVRTKTEVTGIRALAGGVSRSGQVTAPLPNTNLLHPRSLVPQLRGRIEPGNTLLAAAVLGSSDVERAVAAWAQAPTLPDAPTLDRLRDDAREVTSWAATLSTAGAR